MRWRERIVEARARGHFTDDDRRCAAHIDRCAVGESTASVDFDIGVIAANFYGVGSGNDGALVFMDLVNHDDFDAAERLLDAIEDRVLSVKRTP